MVLYTADFLLLWVHFGPCHFRKNKTHSAEILLLNMVDAIFNTFQSWRLSVQVQVTPHLFFENDDCKVFIRASVMIEILPCKAVSDHVPSDWELVLFPNFLIVDLQCFKCTAIFNALIFFILHRMRKSLTA